MDYNEVYSRMALIISARPFAKGGKALTETLVLRAAYMPAVSEFENKKQAISSDKEAAPEAIETALHDAAAEECTAPDRRYSLAAFEQIADAALADGGPVAIPDGSEMPVYVWLEMLFDCLVNPEL